MFRSPLPTLLIAFATGFAIWVLSPWLTGHAEPWDAPGGYYFFALLLAGAVAGLIATRPLWAHYVGGFSGQLVYGLLFLPIGPLAVVGLLFLFVWSLVFLAGAFVGSRLRVRARGR